MKHNIFPVLLQEQIPQLDYKGCLQKQLLCKREKLKYRTTTMTCFLFRRSGYSEREMKNGRLFLLCT